MKNAKDSKPKVIRLRPVRSFDPSDISAGDSYLTFRTIQFRNWVRRFWLQIIVVGVISFLLYAYGR